MRQSPKPYDRVGIGLSSSPLPRCDEYALVYPECLGGAFAATDKSVAALYQLFGLRGARLPIRRGAENQPVRAVPRCLPWVFIRSYPAVAAVSSAIP